MTSKQTLFGVAIIAILAVIIAFFAGTFVSPPGVSTAAVKVGAQKDSAKATSDAEKAAEAADTAAASARKAADSTKDTAQSAEKSASDTADSAKAAEQSVDKVK